MQELLCAADCLITDYSSCIWDYALMGRPCFLFVPDLEEYTNKEQGLFVPIDQWPGVVCKDNDELCEQVRNSDRAEARAAAKERAQRHLRTYGSYEEGKACERLNALVQELRGR